MQAGRYRRYIFKGLVAPLADVPFHDDADGVDRVCWQGFPVHLSLHQVNGVEHQPSRYVRPHRHDHPEINVLVAGDAELVYSIQLGEETYTVAAPAAIWIPAGLVHSANVVRGSGYFLCSVLDDRYVALAPLDAGDTDHPDHPDTDLKKAS